MTPQDRPIKPDELDGQPQVIPEAAFRVLNDEIQKNWYNGQSVLIDEFLRSKLYHAYKTFPTLVSMLILLDAYKPDWDVVISSDFCDLSEDKNRLIIFKKKRVISEDEKIARGRHGMADYVNMSPHDFD